MNFQISSNGTQSILFYHNSFSIVSAILVIVVFYLSRKTDETDYEEEMKRLRQLLIKGKLDRDSLLNIRAN